MVLPVDRVHVQWVQMRVSVVMFQMRVEMDVIEFLVYLYVYTGHFDTYVGEPGGCWVMVYADDVLDTGGIGSRPVAFVFAFAGCECDPAHDKCWCVVQ